MNPDWGIFSCLTIKMENYLLMTINIFNRWILKINITNIIILYYKCIMNTYFFWLLPFPIKAI